MCARTCLIRTPPIWLPAIALIVVVGLSAGAAARAAEEVRALWVVRTSLTSPQAVSAVVQTARARGFNTLLVQARGRGDAYFTGGLEPRAADLAGQPASFDPLRQILDEAHRAGLRVHAWINVNLVSSAAQIPAEPEHIVHRHPDWLMVPHALADEMATADPQSPAYVGKLARWTRGQSQEVEGLYVSPIIPAVVAHMNNVVADLVTRYSLDGINLDYLRYPNNEFDYSRSALAQFRAEVAPEVQPAERDRLDTWMTTQSTIYAEMFPERWSTFRRSRLTSLLMRLRTTIKSKRPTLPVGAAVFPDPKDAFEWRLQDWRTWVDNGLVDIICPLAYTQDAAVFAEQIAAVRQLAIGRQVWAGIGAYRLPPSQTVGNIMAARRLGADGVALFSYDSLAESTHSRADAIAEISRLAFDEQPVATGGEAR